jgi:hypothetical protein
MTRPEGTRYQLEKYEAALAYRLKKSFEIRRVDENLNSHGY